MASFIQKSNNDGWGTPPDEITDVILPVLEEVDLDPTGGLLPFLTSKVTIIPPETLVDLPPGYEFNDGMTVSWVERGPRVFVNPTYGETWSEEKRGPKPDWWHPLSMWVEKMHDEARKGATVLALLPASTQTRWFHNHVAGIASAFCLRKGRVKFVDPATGQVAKQPGHNNLSVLWAYDNKDAVKRFTEVMKPRGYVSCLK